MSRPPTATRPPIKDMYWFAHGGIENGSDKSPNQKEGEEDVVDSASPSFRKDDSKALTAESSSSSGPSSLELREKHIAAEERRKQLWEAEQERNDAVMKKHLEREAALEARRNAQRSTISFAFGSSIPRNVDTLAAGDSDRHSRQPNAGGISPKEENHISLHDRQSVSPFNSHGQGLEVDRSSPLSSSSQYNSVCERRTFSPHSSLVGSGALIGGEDLMTRSMTAAVPASRGRRKNDLMPAVPYERIPAPKASSSVSSRKRSVSMTRLDQLAQPRKHYVEANKAGSANSSVHKDMIKSPTRPLSSASEQSGSSGRPGNAAVKRVRSSPRKPRPVSIAGTVPDHKMDFKVSPIKKTPGSAKKLLAETKKAVQPVSKPSKQAEKPKPAPKVATAKPSKAVTSTPKAPKQPTQPKASPVSPKELSTKKTVTNKKKADMLNSPLQPAVVSPAATPPKEATSPSEPLPADATEADHAAYAKRITSEEEAKAALAEKRRLAREQAEKEAELERQRQEELKRQEEERLRLEEEEQKRLEEEHFRLIEEHRKLEEEKLKKAIEENERKEEEERLKREEEQRLKVEQEKKMQEEAEKQRIELEEKLRKEEEERAERKKRLEKIMSRTRGKTSGSSPSGSISGSDQLDSSENQADNQSSEANSLDSNGTEVAPCGPDSIEAGQEKSEIITDGASIEAHPMFEAASDNESLHDIVMPKSETASQDNSLVMLQDRDDFKESIMDNLVESSVDDDPVPEMMQVVEDGSSVPGKVEQATENDKLDANLIVQDKAQVSSEKESVFEDTISKAEVPQLESVLHASQDQSVEEPRDSMNQVDANPILEPAKSSISDVDAADLDQHSSHFSTSSDMKLPDPIYENTSDEGSVSSERHLDHNSFAFREEDGRQEPHMVDEVFSEREVSEQLNPFEQQDARSQSMAAYESQFDVGGMQDSIYAYETSDAPLPDVLEQPREFGEEDVYPSRSSTSSLVDLKAASGLDSEAQNKVLDDETLSSPFCAIPSSDSAADSQSTSVLRGDNPFLAEASASKEQSNCQTESSQPLVKADDNINVTIVESEDKGKCIGLISSVENDRISNDLTVQQSLQNEQFKSNFDYHSVTESEDSSLDSNLSQVMTGDVTDVNDLVGLSNESSKPSGLSNGQEVNPLREPAVNGNSDSKLNGEHFYHDAETLKNGHKLESSNLQELGDLVQLVDGKHMSPVDHPASNIFDSVEAVSFGKMGQDPFLAKGGSNQISGNPFLLQEDQKQVLMTPDFFN